MRSVRFVVGEWHNHEIDTNPNGRQCWSKTPNHEIRSFRKEYLEIRSFPKEFLEIRSFRTKSSIRADVATIFFTCTDLMVRDKVVFYRIEARTLHVLN